MNRLADAHSPYLLQHKDNPVDWFPWGDEAFENARQRNLPIFLSVGYAACHWCHVMEHESFENKAIAEILNAHFVSIKVDREERPDIDSIYMNAVQVMTQRGGWPMSVFLDHQRRPFYAGTYWPPQSRMGMPGFVDVLNSISAAWTNRQDEVASHADQITDALKSLADPALQQTQSADPSFPDRQVLQRATTRLMQSADKIDGGFGSAPKFPHATDLLWLIRCLSRVSRPHEDFQTNPVSVGDQVEPDHELTRKRSSENSNIHVTDETLAVVRTTIDSMAAGGLQDHLGGGFSRYSVDAKWLVPHFEKMLYDNALLAMVFTRMWQYSQHAGDRHTAQQTLDYIISDLSDPGGGFHCSEDADSEGVEGKFYVWTVPQIIEVLGESRGERFCQIYDVTERGNFEDSNILHLPRPISDYAEAHSIDLQTLHAELTGDRAKLLAARADRVRPGLDNKVITAWSALATEALAIAGCVLGRQDYIDRSVESADFLIRNDDERGMLDSQGSLWHAFRNGHRHIKGMADDYSNTINALIAVYHATAQARFLTTAVVLANGLLERFEDHQRGGFYYTAADQADLLTRNKEWHDASMISANAAAAIALWRLGLMTENQQFMDAAHRTVAAGRFILEQQSTAAAGLILAADLLQTVRGTSVISLVDHSSFIENRQTIYNRSRSDRLIVWNVGGMEPAAAAVGKPAIDDSPTLYECIDFTCSAPRQLSL